VGVGDFEARTEARSKGGEQVTNTQFTELMIELRALRGAVEALAMQGEPRDWAPSAVEAHPDPEGRLNAQTQLDREAMRQAEAKLDAATIPAPRATGVRGKRGRK
jgi:hypothetical protein